MTETRPVTWGALLRDASRRLGSEVDARRITERASGYDGAELALALDVAAPRRAVVNFEAMVDRCLRGEPLQYVLGRWGFRNLDLYLDRRVLIPRPETEVVVDVAITEAKAMAGDGLVAVDLGTGSGAIALSLAVELPGASVWGTEASADALAVARANLAGLGVAARRVRLVEGDWFEPLPWSLRGSVGLVVANPPYVAEDEVEALPSEVADWEPRGALVAGPTGLEAISRIVAEAPAWLAPSGVLVCEIAPHQADAVLGMARSAGFTYADVRPDLSGRLRALVARRWSRAADPR